MLSFMSHLALFATLYIPYSTKICSDPGHHAVPEWAGFPLPPTRSKTAVFGV